MLEQQLENEKVQILRDAKKRAEEEKEAEKEAEAAPPAERKRKHESPEKDSKSDWDAPVKPKTEKEASKWDAPTPTRQEVDAGATPGGTRKSRWDQTPVSRTAGEAGSKWDSTPGATPRRGGKSRWDETPDVSGMMMNAQTPGASVMRNAITPEQYYSMMYEDEVSQRNRPWTDEELDSILPSEGYTVLEQPATYVPIRTPNRKIQSTPTPLMTPAYQIPTEKPSEAYGMMPGTPGSDLPMIKPEDMQFFGQLLHEDLTDESQETKEVTIMKVLLKIKNGTPIMRKQGLRQLTEEARRFGAAALFNQILPLLMSPTLEDQERHLLVKVIDRVLYKLDDLVRPFVHKILVVIEPMLIDEDYYARVEGREIIANLAKAAGLATMIANLRPDIDHQDEYVRNTTARAFAVVASALGIPSLLPFLKAVCLSKKSWQARHTGIKIIQQIAVLIGCGVLPHLKNMVEIVQHGLDDEQQKVRTMTALALAGLAESSAPYGIEAFDAVLKPLWVGTRSHRGKVLAAFLKAIGYIIPLMDPEHAAYYTKDIVPILLREFQTPDEEMKKIVLKVVKQCVSTDGVDASTIRIDIMPEFFRHFWVRRMALDRRNYKQLVETTVEIAKKVGGAEIMSRVVEDLKDESEAYRKMVMECIEQVINNLGVADVDQRLEEQLIDGILYAFQEQVSDDNTVMLNGTSV
jgi:splicing factor 3B subunit 1